VIPSIIGNYLGRVARRLLIDVYAVEDNDPIVDSILLFIVPFTIWITIFSTSAPKLKYILS